jgi:hypothetical protein
MDWNDGGWSPQRSRDNSPRWWDPYRYRERSPSPDPSASRDNSPDPYRYRERSPSPDPLASRGNSPDPYRYRERSPSPDPSTSRRNSPRWWDPYRYREGSPLQDVDGSRRSQSPETREFLDRSPSRSPARDQNLIGMGINPGEWLDPQVGPPGTSPWEMEQGSSSRMDEVREWMYGRGGWTVFENRLEEQLAEELALARKVGVRPLHVEDVEFGKVANEERKLNWVVTQWGDLLFAPQWVLGEEIPHTALTGGGPVVAAGEAEIVVMGEERLCVDITNGSGHYLPDERSLSIGVQAFQTFGITFVNEPEVYGDKHDGGCSREELEAAREELEERLRILEMGNRGEDEAQGEVWEHDGGSSSENGGRDDGKLVVYESSGESDSENATGDGHQKSTDTTTENQVVKFEKEIMHKPLEHGQFFTKDGDLIGDIIVGKASSLDLWDYRDIAKDAIFTHNHPQNGQLSMEDLETAAGFDMQEIRAITADGRTFSMTRGAEGWKVFDLKDIKEIEDKAKRELFRDPVARKCYQEGNEDAVWKMLFEKIAEKIGGVYHVS